MALTGLEIYKLLPQTNCKECGFPTCLAFAMKLAAKQAELQKCPYVTEESKAKLEAAAMPPIRLVTISSDGAKVAAGNETVLYRHEKAFYHRPGLFVRLRASDAPSLLKDQAAQADAYRVEYVGIELELDGFALDAAGAEETPFVEAVRALRSVSRKPLILMAPAAGTLAAARREAGEGQPLFYAADESNWEEMAGAALAEKCPLAVRAPSLDGLAALTEKLRAKGVEDLVLDPMARQPGASLAALTQIRRLALKKSFRPLGYPILTFPGEAQGVDPAALAAQHIAKYAGFVVLDRFDPAEVYPLLVLRQNIYTDPQKPIQVQPGLYEINGPDTDAPLMVTTNFSITYFSVNNEVEGSGWPGWLLVVDAEGMSVLTAWAAGKFDADRIAKAVKTTEVESRLNHHRLIIPGQVAVISGELEESLPGWEIMVGPKEAVDIPAFLKVMWGAKVT
jgi:acetyl-CoA decarbonylase/synthase complex subunit gamma